MENGNVEEVNEIRKKVRRTWWEDGLVEIFTGVLVLFVGIGLLILEILTVWGIQQAVRIVLFIVAIAGAGSYYWVQKWLKAKYVWKKAGYSVPSYDNLTNLFVLIGSLFVLLLVVNDFWSHFRIGGLFAGSSVFFFWFATFSFSGLKRFLVIGSFSFILGIIGVIFKMNGISTLQIIIGFLGVASLVSGIKVNREFRREKFNEG